MKLPPQLGLGALQSVALRFRQRLAGAVDIKGQHRERGAIGGEPRSAERLSDAAIFFALVCLKTPCFRSSASLSCVTRCDQRFGDAFFSDDFLRAELAFLTVVLRVLLLAVLRVAALREWAVLRCSAMINSTSLQPKNGRRPNRFRWAMRELLRRQGVGECGLI